MSARCLAWIAVVALAAPGPVRAGGRGAIFVADGGDAIVRISPDTGAQQAVPIGAFVPLQGLAVEPSRGDLVIADPGAYRGRDGEIARVDRVDGERTTLSRRELLVDPEAVVVASDGTIFTAGAVQDLLRIPPDGSSQTRLLRTDRFEFRGLGIDRRDRPLLLVRENGVARLLRVDPQSGATRAISEGGRLVDPRGVAVDCRNRIFVLDQESRILEIRPASGRQRVLARGEFTGVAGLATDRLGDLLLTDSAEGAGRVRRLDVVSGALDTLAEGDLLDEPGAVAVDPGPGDLDPLLTCGAHADWTADEFLTLRGEQIAEQGPVDLVLRLGEGAWSLWIGDEITLSGASETRGSADDRLVLVPDEPSSERLLGWLEERMSDLRGEATRLRERVDEPDPLVIRVKFNSKRTRAVLRLRARLEANTEPEILPVRYGFDVRGAIDGLRPLPEDSGGGDGGPVAGEPKPGNPGVGEIPGVR